MIKTFKVKALKNAIKVGESIPIQDKSGNPGNIGNWIEKTLIERGHILQSGKGPDIAEINVEVKTRNIEATSAHSVGSMSYSDIVGTSYKHSTVHDKFQYQYRVEYKQISESESEVMEAQVYDFSTTVIQDLINDSYEVARQNLTKNPDQDYYAGNGYGYFERVGDTNHYQYRISPGPMKHIKSLAGNTFDTLFSIL